MSIDLNCPTVEAIKVLTYLKKYVSLEDPAHQHVNVLEIVFLCSKSVLTCRSVCTCPGNPRLGREQSGERKKALECAALAGQAGALFLPQENFRPIKFGRKYIFYANLQPTPADEMYQDFENPEHGKFWSGGKSPVIGT